MCYKIQASLLSRASRVSHFPSSPKLYAVEGSNQTDRVLESIGSLIFIYPCLRGEMGSLPHQSWWEREPLFPNRRQGLPHTESKMPTTSDVWKIIKHMVHSVFLKSSFA